MNIEKIRNTIKDKEGQNLKFKFNGARNQIEEFGGKIINVYPAVFIIEVDNLTNTVRSFSYSDVLTNSLEIIETDIEL